MTEINVENAELMAKVLWASRIKNEHIRIGIMCVIAKECGFELVRETSYSNTSPERIRKIFRSRVADMSDIDLASINGVDFFNHVYGGKIGNNNENDGYLYRGAGWPQLTGKANFKKYCPEWISIEALPTYLVCSPFVAAQVAIRFFSAGFLKRSLLTMRYGSPTTDEIGIKWAANIAAGIGRGKKSAVMNRAIKNASRYQVEIRNIYDRCVR